MTSMSRPCFSDAANFSAALSIAGFFQRSSFWQTSSMSRAPARKLSISKPMHAASVNPTSVKTVKRPPTPSGTANCFQPLSIASFLSSVGFSSFGSVTATTSTSILSAFVNASYITMKFDIVSSVPPDFEMTRSMMRSGCPPCVFLICATSFMWLIMSPVRRGSMLLPLK